MSSTIIIKNSSTPGGSPSSLTQGEIAINVTDGKLFYGSGSTNTVKELSTGITGLNLSQIATGSVTASVSPTQFTVTSGSVTEFQVTGTGVTIGNAITDIHRVTGSLNISGSTTITGSLSTTEGITGSLFGTSSWSNNATTASYVLQAVSSSYALTASYALNAGGGGSGGTDLGLVQAMVVGLQNIF
jgi:hypothetical protein